MSGALYKKMESGRGIRLLGVGCENMEDQSSPIQKELFDFGEEKKARVEEAIYKMKNKNPGLEVTKARLLKK